MTLQGFLDNAIDGGKGILQQQRNGRSTSPRRQAPSLICLVNWATISLF
ncbi:MAG: hypothetical protein LCH47_10055 [Proteobacteria bacterium]|nr:hypothetical protein [Pseudomonadota bacterium]MCA0421782.1 hypothetical protein [Pseudomonadota bacterium]